MDKSYCLYVQIILVNFKKPNYLIIALIFMRGFPGKDSQLIKNPCRRPRFDPWVGKIPWRSKWQPIPVFLPGKSRGWRSLVGYSPQGHKESNTTEWLPFHILASKDRYKISIHMLLYRLSLHNRKIMKIESS